MSLFYICKLSNEVFGVDEGCFSTNSKEFLDGLDSNKQISTEPIDLEINEKVKKVRILYKTGKYILN